MSRRRQREPEQIDLYRDETVVIPAGEPGYWLLLDDAEAEQLAAGICPDRVKACAEQMLGWKKPAADDPFFNPLARTADEIVEKAGAA